MSVASMTLGRGSGVNLGGARYSVDEWCSCTCERVLKAWIDEV